MKLQELQLFTDENIDTEFLDYLRSKGFNVFDIKENNLSGSMDDVLLALSYEQNRVIITLDSDFGTLIY